MVPKVTIIIPLYNVESYAGSCIQSVRSQTFSDWEAVCVNDASTDDSFILAQHAAKDDKRFRFLEHDANKGLSVARNTGLKVAQSTYVMFLDSDDMLVPTAIERLVEVAEKNKLDVLDFNAQAFFEDGIEQNSRQEAEYLLRKDIDGVHTGPELFSIYWQQQCYKSPAPFHFIKRELLEQYDLQFMPGILHEDELFSPLLHAVAQRAMFINEPLYLYRIHTSSIVTSARGIKNVAGLFAASEELHNWLQANATDYSNEFIDAFTQDIWVLRNAMARDILQCSGEDLVAFQETLTPAQRANFYEHGIQLATSIQDQENSRTWKIASTLRKLPHGFSRLVLKKK